ncbi:MAG: DoxX family protein [Akkermansiaceae bacterium]
MPKALLWILRIVPAIILLQTLPFKFLAKQESVDLFTTLTSKALGNGELEALARIGTGVVELIAAIFILIPKFSVKGALLTAGTMAGALVSHILFLGFEGMAGRLAGLAAIALIFAIILIAKKPAKAS